MIPWNLALDDLCTYLAVRQLDVEYKTVDGEGAHNGTDYTNTREDRSLTR